MEESYLNSKIPGFNDGHFSVQDEAAQLASSLIEASEQSRILDACAAPGGKTGHLAERFPQAHITALDNEESRLERIHQNLSRLRAQATVICGDASQPELWQQGGMYDAILIDAHCSATVSLRRQADGK